MPRRGPTPADPIRRSRLALCLLAAPLVLAACLTADPARATLLGVPGPWCLVGEALGSHACPGCGLTRSTVLAARGALRESWSVHPAGWLVVLLCAAGVLVHADVLRRGARTPAHDRLLRLGWRTFGAGIAAAWLLRLAVSNT